MLDRSAFLYMEGSNAKFAQCASCMFWLAGRDRCELHRDTDKIGPGYSCGLYVNGKPKASGRPLGKVTPAQSGLVDRQVRCENCKHFGPMSTCGLYAALNTKMAKVFKLDSKVVRHGCCNAQEAK